MSGARSSRQLARAQPGSARPTRCARGQLTAVRLSGATVPVREPPVLTDVALAAGGQPVMKCGCTVVDRRRGFTGGHRASHRHLRPPAYNGQHLRRNQRRLYSQGSPAACLAGLGQLT
jgi:hypothetical protein